MAEVNIDGAHIARLSTKNERDNLVQMQNGNAPRLSPPLNTQESVTYRAPAQ